jgi:hypothetical protein
MHKSSAELISPLGAWRIYVHIGYQHCTYARAHKYTLCRHRSAAISQISFQ